MVVNAPAIVSRKVENGQNKYFDQLSGAHSTQKVVEIQQLLCVIKIETIEM